MLCLPDLPPLTHPPLLNQKLRKSISKFFLSIFSTVHCVKPMKRVVMMTSQIIFAINTKLSATPARFTCPNRLGLLPRPPSPFYGTYSQKIYRLAQYCWTQTPAHNGQEGYWSRRSSQSWIFVRYVLLSIPLTIIEITYVTIPSYRSVSFQFLVTYIQKKLTDYYPPIRKFVFQTSLWVTFIGSGCIVLLKDLPKDEA